MGQTLNLKIKGLYLDPNELSEVPEGALSVADNIVIDKDSVAESRRGQRAYGNTLNLVGVESLFEYRRTPIISYDEKLAYDSDGEGGWLDYAGTFEQPDAGFKLRSFSSNRTFYVTTSEGVRKLDAIDGVFRQAGAIKALDGIYTAGLPPAVLIKTRP